jgi:hypothetical protein
MSTTARPGVVRLSALTKEFVRFKVSAKENGVTINPTGDTIEMQFPVHDAQPSGSWTAVQWEVDTTGPTPVYYGRTTVGAGATFPLTAGSYDAYVRITDGSTERVVRLVGYLTLV